MITDVKKLIQACADELKDRQYRSDYVRLLSGHWETLSRWMEANAIAAFTETVASQYCDLHIGHHVLSEEMDDLGVKTTLQKIAMHTKINNFLKI